MPKPKNVKSNTNTKFNINIKFTFTFTFPSFTDQGAMGEAERTTDRVTPRVNSHVVNLAKHLCRRDSV
ncbi:hypothetical protein HAV15_012616 [Penicillium sp. str. |nr:hypothetical protein HAV15_012616 [Penicillium sp. str. \